MFQPSKGQLQGVRQIHFDSKVNKFKTDLKFSLVSITSLFCVPRQKDARGENTKINYGLDTMGEKEKRTSKENLDRRSTSSHDNKKFRTESVEKQRVMAFGFRKKATAIKKTGQIDR